MNDESTGSQETMTPRTLALLVLDKVRAFFASRISPESWETVVPTERALRAEHAFIQQVIAPLTEQRLSGDELAEQVFALTETHGAEGIPLFFVAPIIVIAYCTQAIKEEERGLRDKAWTLVAESKYWLGILENAEIHVRKKPNPAAELATKRHSENYALAEEALKYWRENIDTSLSAAKAANELVRVVPLSHKKLSELVSAEKKKQL